MGDASARRNIIGNACGLVRGTRGRGVVISSEARRAADLRGPFDVVNFATFWGVKQEFGMGDGGKVVLHSRARRETYKGAVQVVGEEVKEKERREERRIEERGKRKVEDVDLDVVEAPVKKRGKKKRKR
jgi:ribonuclease P/MRP protein subunit RPP1